MSKQRRLLQGGVLTSQGQNLTNQVIPHLVWRTISGGISEEAAACRRW